MKVEMLSGGWFTSAAGIWRRDDDLDRQVRFAIPAYVIETDEERVLDDHRFPIFADNFAAQAASAERLRALRDAGAVVRPGHDPTVLAPGPVLV